MKVEVSIRQEFEWAGIGIYITARNENGQRFVVKPLNMTFETLTPTGGLAIEPTIRLDEYQAKTFLDSLANELIRLGYAPDAIKAKAGELEATRYHLEDMRRMVLGVKK